MAPVAPTSYDRLQVAFVRATAICLMAGAGLVGLLLLAGEELTRAAYTLPFLVVGLAGWHFLRRGHHQTAFNVVAIGTWIGTAHALVWTNGVFAPTIAAFVAVILLAGWIAGGRITMGLTLATVVLLFALATSASWGTGWPRQVAMTPFQAAFIESVIMVAAGALGHFAARSQRERVDSLEASRHALSEKIEALGQQEVALRASESKFAAAFHSSPAALLITRTSDRHIVEVNPGFERIFGRTREESIGQRPMALGLWRDNVLRQQIVSDVYARHDIVDAPIIGIHRDGSEIECRISARFVEIDGEEHILWSVRDVTVETRAQFALAQRERELAQANRRLRDQIALHHRTEQVAHVGHWVTDLGIDRVAWSDSIFDLMGLEKRGPMTVAEAKVYGELEPKDALYQARAELDGLPRIYRLTRNDGVVRWVRIAFLRPPGEPGTERYFGVVQDITDEHSAKLEVEKLNADLERRVAERTAELQAAMKELDAFSYSVAHDLNTPLRAIHGFASILEEDAQDRLAPTERAALQRIREGTSRMGELIADLLTLSRVTRSELRRERVDLSALARRIAAERDASDPSRQVEWRIAPGLACQCDKGLAQSLLANLLGNAWKYTRGRDHAVIELAATGGTGDLIEYVVRDNGAGFDNALAARIFAPFVRLHRQSEFEGNGIGLATVERIVARHGGTVRAHGEAGRGAEFHFTLPAPPA